MKKINILKTKKSKKRILGIGSLVCITLIFGLSLLYYLIDPKKLFHLNTNENVYNIVNENECDNDITWDMASLEQLDNKIKERNQELENPSLEIKKKENIKKIIQKQQIQREEIQRKIDFHVYCHQLEQEINELDKKINPSLSLEEKHFLTEDKLKKEKELIFLKEKKVLFREKEEIQHQILKKIVDKLKDVNLSSIDKTNLNQEKDNFEKKLEELKKEIKTIVNQIQLKNKINILKEEIENEKDDSLKKLFEEEKTNFEKQLEK